MALIGVEGCMKINKWLALSVIATDTNAATPENPSANKACSGLLSPVADIEGVPEDSMWPLSLAIA